MVLIQGVCDLVQGRPKRTTHKAVTSLITETVSLRAPQWLKLTRVDNLFSAFYSRDGRHWKILGRATVVMPEEVAVGVGVSGAARGGHAVSGAQVDFVRDGRSLGNDWFTPQVRLAGGSMQMGDLLEMDDAQVRFGAYSAAPVPTRSVINIRFRPVTARVARRLNDGRTGVYLPSGEFVAGEIRGIRSGQVVLSSVPLGLLRFDIGAEVMAIAMRKPGPVERRPCRLKAADGSVWHATTMEVSGDRVILRDASFGIRRVPIHEVIELWWGGAAGKS